MELRESSHLASQVNSALFSKDRKYFHSVLKKSSELAKSSNEEQLRDKMTKHDSDTERETRNTDAGRKMEKRFNPVQVESKLSTNVIEHSLSELDLEESGYLEGSSAFENGVSDHAGSKILATNGEGTQFNNRRLDFGFKGQFVNTEIATEEHFRNSGNEESRQRNNNYQIPNDVLSWSFSSSICSDESSLEGDLTNEHTRLTSVINNIDPKRLHNYLKRKLKQKDSNTISALGTLLPKRKFKGETLHCVRCHKEYDPKHGDKNCVLFHKEDDVMKISEDESGADFGCEKCGNVFRLEGKWKYKQSSNKKHNCGPCFSGKHTVCTDDVIYEPEGLSKTCEDHGCIVFYV